MLLTPRQAQFAFVPSMVVVMSATISFAMTLIHHGIAAGFVQAWLNNWGLAFAIALPIAWVAVPLLRGLLAMLTRPPSTGGRSLGEMG